MVRLQQNACLNGVSSMRMLILRGVAGRYAGQYWPRGALFEGPALEYARRMGYKGQVLPIAGATGVGNLQSVEALKALRNDLEIRALYGFSGGGYNILRIIRALTSIEKHRLRLVVVLGAPKNPEVLYKGSWKLVYRKDPPKGHMYGPYALLDEIKNVGDWLVSEDERIV
jgi:hypothetical protein